MRIAIDARVVTNKKDAGLITYVLNLIKYLKIVAPDNLYFCYVDKRDILLKDNKSCKAWAGLENHIIGDLWEQLWLPIDLHIKKVDIYHGTAARLPAINSSKYILTVYDMVAFKHPEFASKRFSLYTRKLLKSAVRRADKIIAISEHTKKDIIEILKVPSEDVEVIYPGVDDIFKVMDKEWAYSVIKRKYNLNKRFILSVGNLEPRKNTKNLLLAYKLLLDEHLNHQLVIVGPQGWKAQEIFDFVEKIGISENVIITGYVDSNEMPILYNAADVFVFPSLYEGFGLPPLEAMACGTPVVASNNSSLPEILGDAAIMVNPLNVEDIKERIKRVLFDKTLREKMISLGLERVKDFSWEKTVRQTLEIYKDAC